MPLQWKKLSDYAIEDVTGKFRVCRSHVRDEWVYAAWRSVTVISGDGSPPEKNWVAICYVKDPETAKSSCEKEISQAA